MLDPSCKSFTFEEISEELPHENAYPKIEILKRLLSDFWRDKFDHRNLGWNEPRARLFLGLQDLFKVDESSPCPSRSVSEEDDCARPHDFQLMSREIAFDLLLAVKDPLAFNLCDESDRDPYEYLAEYGWRDLDLDGQAVMENIAITKDELCRWCKMCRVKLPQSFEQAPPQKRQQAAPEAQTTQGSEPPSGGGRKEPRKVGRPSTKREIEEIYKALRDAGEVDYNAPKNAVYEKIRGKVKKGPEGFGNEAIRRAIKPLFDRDKKLIGNL